MPEISGIGIAAAFLAGLTSFLSPCVLPLVPGYVSYVAGRSLDELQQQKFSRARLSAIVLSLLFVLGFSTVFVILGASATALSQLLLSYRYETNIIGGIIIILFGVFTIGLVRPSWLQRDLRFGQYLRGGHPLGAFMLGLAFAFGWTPCIGPILGAILTVSASSGNTVNGISLLAIYSLGLGLPFLIAASFTDAFLQKAKTARRFGRPFQIAAGVIMVAMGIAMITGYLSSFAYWLLTTFPILGRIG